MFKQLLHATYPQGNLLWPGVYFYQKPVLWLPGKLRGGKECS